MVTYMRKKRLYEYKLRIFLFSSLKFKSKDITVDIQVRMFNNNWLQKWLHICVIKRLYEYKIHIF